LRRLRVCGLLFFVSEFLVSNFEFGDLGLEFRFQNLAKESDIRLNQAFQTRREGEMYLPELDGDVGDNADEGRGHTPVKGADPATPPHCARSKTWRQCQQDELRSSITMSRIENSTHHNPPLGICHHPGGASGPLLVTCFLGFGQRVQTSNGPVSISRSRAPTIGPV
jgi:hypothetical protein